MAREIHEPTASTRRGTAAVLTAVVFWGMGNVLVKYIRLPGLGVAFYRLVIGAVVYSVVLRMTGGRLTRKAILIAAPGGIAFGLDMALFFVSLKHTSVADASVITAMQPALVFLVAGRLFGEHLSRRMFTWTGIAVIGVVIAIIGSASAAGRTLFGDLAAAASLVAWSYYFVASKQARRQLTAFEYQAAMTVVAAFVIAPLALAQPHDLAIPDLATFGWVLVMVLIPGGGHLLVNWAQLLHHHLGIHPDAGHPRRRGPRRRRLAGRAAHRDPTGGHRRGIGGAGPGPAAAAPRGHRRGFRARRLSPAALYLGHSVTTRVPPAAVPAPEVSVFWMHRTVAVGAGGEHGMR